VRTLLRILAVVLLLTSALIAQTENWIKYKNADGNFSVLLPKEPEDRITNDKPEMVTHVIMALDQGTMYSITFATMLDDQIVTEATYDIYRDAVFKGMSSCLIGDENPPTPALEGYVGHSYKLNCIKANKPMTMVGSLYWGKRHAYAVLVMFPGDPPPDATLKAFLNSFTNYTATK
jgi:hypothetical protein